VENNIRQLQGTVAAGHGVAGCNMKRVEAEILERTGPPSMGCGTLNVVLPHKYMVHEDVAMEPLEYFTGESSKLQRYRVRGRRMWIMRPNTHEPGEGAKSLELISDLRLRDAFGFSIRASLTIEIDEDDAW